jgi:hypothetical protein
MIANPVTARKDDALAAHQALASVRKDHAACNVCKFLARVALLEIHGYVA